MQNCPNCTGKRWLKTGKKNEDGVKFWKCWRCGKVVLGDYPIIRLSPRTLYIDLEISLSEYYNFGNRVPSRYLSPKNLKNEYYIICWAAKWIGEKKIFSACVSPEDAGKWTDANIMFPLWALMDAADIVVGHNVDKFDVKRANTRFLVNGFKPPEKYRTLDTLKIARSKFAFESNTLDFISTRFGFRPKDAMDGEDWRRVIEGDPATLRKMAKYNRGDVVSGANVFEVFTGWASKPINFGTQTFPKSK